MVRIMLNVGGNLGLVFTAEVREAVTIEGSLEPAPGSVLLLPGIRLCVAAGVGAHSSPRCTVRSGVPREHRNPWLLHRRC